MTIPGKRYAKATTVKRYANTSRSSKKSTRVIPAAMKRSVAALKWQACCSEH
jgi:hypothetical protein